MKRTKIPIRFAEEVEFPVYIRDSSAPEATYTNICQPQARVICAPPILETNDITKLFPQTEFPTTNYVYQVTDQPTNGMVTIEGGPSKPGYSVKRR